MAATFPHLQKNRQKVEHTTFISQDFHKFALISGNYYYQFNLSRFNILIFFARNLPIAIVWCGPHSENCFIKMPFVSFHNKLMSTANDVNIIGRIKLKQTHGILLLLGVLIKSEVLPLENEGQEAEEVPFQRMALNRECKYCSIV